jgi:hypothetical protein
LSDRDQRLGENELPFPQSLCHRCAAPPRYVRSDRGSIFVHCPLLQRYPPQPVTTCADYVSSPLPAGG